MMDVAVDLSDLLNARAATTDRERGLGGFNAWGNSLPAEELPFGGVVQVGDVEFHLPERGTQGDHVEALGQLIPLKVRHSISRLHLLACGEMGPQELEIRVGGWRSALEVPGWLVDEHNLIGDTTEPPSLRLSHLHYPGDYELAMLRPVLWRCDVPLVVPQRIENVRLSLSPLVHVFAITVGVAS